MEFYEILNGEYPKNRPINTEKQYFGNGWSVLKKNNKYFLEYLSGEIQGKLKRIEIDEEDFIKAKDNKMELEDFCMKYKIW